MDYKFDMEVGKKIRFYRKKLHMTQDQLAAKLQISGCDLPRTAVAKIVSGQRHIYLYELKIIRDVLKVSFDDLLL